MLAVLMMNVSCYPGQRLGSFPSSYLAKLTHTHSLLTPLTVSLTHWTWQHQHLLCSLHLPATRHRSSPPRPLSESVVVPAASLHRVVHGSQPHRLPVAEVSKHRSSPVRSQSKSMGRGVPAASTAALVYRSIPYGLSVLAYLCLFAKACISLERKSAFVHFNWGP